MLANFADQTVELLASFDDQSPSFTRDAARPCRSNRASILVAALKEEIGEGDYPMEGFGRLMREIDRLGLDTSTLRLAYRRLSNASRYCGEEQFGAGLYELRLLEKILKAQKLKDRPVMNNAQMMTAAT